MALQLAVQNANLVGGDFDEAYAKIDVARSFADHTLICVTFYSNANARQLLLSPVHQIDVRAPFDGRPHADLYNWLKTQPEFAGAVDV